MSLKIQWLSKERKISEIVHQLESRQETVMTELQIVAQ